MNKFLKTTAWDKQKKIRMKKKKNLREKLKIAAILGHCFGLEFAKVTTATITTTPMILIFFFAHSNWLEFLLLDAIFNSLTWNVGHFHNLPKIKKFF